MKRRPNSFIGRLEAFLAENPGKEMTYQEVADRFHVSLGSVYSRVSEAARAQGKIEVAHVVRLRLVLVKTEENTLP